VAGACASKGGRERAPPEIDRRHTALLSVLQVCARRHFCRCRGKKLPMLPSATSRMLLCLFHVWPSSPPHSTRTRAEFTSYHSRILRPFPDVQSPKLAFAFVSLDGARARVIALNGAPLMLAPLSPFSLPPIPVCISLLLSRSPSLSLPAALRSFLSFELCEATK